MAYKIEPRPLSSFIDDKKIKLPRFQRKATWQDRQNFELAISIFQGYPVGVVIINKEKNASWLLDGRQRRNALKTMRENPVELYKWAVKYLKIKNTHDEIDIKKMFQSKVDAYLQTEDKEDEAYIEELEKEYDQNEEDSFIPSEQTKGLDTLLQIILMVHNKQKNQMYRWIKLFDFRDYFDVIKYVKFINGNKEIDPVSLRKFLLELIEEYLNEYEGEVSKSFFINYYKENYPTNEENFKEFKNDIDRNWDSISKSLEVINRTENVFEEARIGVIELTNASPLDAQNIFSRINSGGTKLKSEELLSAKPFWNITYPTDEIDLIENIEDLYNKLGVSWDKNVVRWDIVAVLVKSIDPTEFLFEQKMNNKILDIETVTLGFKIVSAYYLKGITAKHVNMLETTDKINWSYDLSNLEKELVNVIRFLQNDNYFKILNKWNAPLSKLIGKAPTIEFLIITYLNWLEKNRPHANSGDGKAVLREARILFDKLIYEYCIRRWSGSSDSKVANDLSNWHNRLLPIETEKYINLIKELIHGSINGTKVNQSIITPLIYYFEILHERFPEYQNNKYEIDHIYPKEKFTKNLTVDQNYKDSLTNLIILTSEENNHKKSKDLQNITDKTLVQKISLQAGIDIKEFEKYSDIANINELAVKREQLFINTLKQEREKFIKN